MRIGKEGTVHIYQMNVHELEQVEEGKDLVDIDIKKTLKFHTHTSVVIKKANKILGWIKRSFIALDEKILTEWSDPTPSTAMLFGAHSLWKT